MVKKVKVILANLMILSLMLGNIVFAENPTKVNLDGRIINFDVTPQLKTINIPVSEVEGYKKEGWYLDPVCIMYAPIDSTITVKKRFK